MRAIVEFIERDTAYTLKAAIEHRYPTFEYSIIEAKIEPTKARYGVYLKDSAEPSTLQFAKIVAYAKGFLEGMQEAAAQMN